MRARMGVHALPAAASRRRARRARTRARACATLVPFTRLGERKGGEVQGEGKKGARAPTTNEAVADLSSSGRCQVLLAMRDDHHRKPRVGMWDALAARGGGAPLDAAASVFVGDAAGRPKLPPAQRVKDFASSDREFALNLGLRFATPEAYFLKSTAPVHLCVVPGMALGFDPRSLALAAPETAEAPAAAASAGDDADGAGAGAGASASAGAGGAGDDADGSGAGAGAGAGADASAGAGAGAGGAPAAANTATWLPPWWPTVAGAAAADAAADADAADADAVDAASAATIIAAPELVLLVGSPASGKSRLATQLFEARPQIRLAVSARYAARGGGGA